ncbi:DUF3048 domain-containing protein [Edaphobacillus lindanitolerans]|uniref:DUF3048 domain-containing protein n=1 Tax=Edaphobacillus lindanitolerans TaxID=550447 RepID=A0A1U7PTP7_9BACI|nr:DUF3048 domain-containing protein [Edaphobacillus lindanitolerans]SIT92896.1 Protein of unknown function [Edaphobacillus lindanitolerans]
MKKGWMPALAVICLLAGCQDKDGPETAEPGDDGTVTTGAPAENSYTAPYTGLGMAEAPDMRPVLVTVNNHPKARPQSGLSGADIVYEMLAEGEITRLLALYQSELPDRIGPVRSARDYFVDLAAAHDALYIAHGYSPDAQTMLESGAVDHLNGMKYDGSLFKRSSDRVAPHNSYISGDAILKGADQNGFRMNGPADPDWRFDEELPDAAENAATIEISYGRNQAFESRYTYDPAEGTYARSSGGEATADAETGEELALSNILVLEAPHRIIDEKGRRAIDFGTGGAAYVFRDGLFQKAEWKSLGGVPTVMDGSKPFPLAPGKTWIHVVPDSPGLSGSVGYTE